MVKIAESTPKLYKQLLHSLKSAIANDSSVQTLPVQSKAQLALYSVSYSKQQWATEDEGKNKARQRCFPSVLS